MADRLDVAGRLAEGLPAVEHTQRYVRACQMLGYQHPDLTSRLTQIRDWYDSEDGLDLRVLDNDCAQLRAAAAAVTEVLRMQRAQIGELTAAWTGPAADAAVWFLQRHCDAASMVATEVRAAAQRCEALRDNLWHLVDVKVATAIGIDDRTLTQQSAWLAAADVVSSGVGDRQTAAEVVQQQIKPYVDNDIRDDWLTAMRSTRAGVAASYDMVTDRFAATPAASFEIPGDLGPDRQLRPSGPPARPSAPAATAAVAPVATLPSLPPDPLPPATPTSPTQELGTSWGDAPAMNPGVGGAAGLDGLSGLGGLSGLANRIVESMGGLLGSGAEQFPDEDPFGEDPFDKGTTEHEDKEDDEDEEDEEDDKDHEDAKALPPEGAPPADLAPAADLPPPANQPPLAVAPPADTAGPPAAVPPTTGPAPVRGSPPSGGSTPCEIAADQVPQAGG